MPRAQYWRGPRFDINYRGPTFDNLKDPKTKGKEAEAENTDNDPNELEDEGDELKKKQKLASMTEQQLERAHAMHECGHACVATVLGCDVIDIRFSKWHGGGLTRANYDKSRLSVPDRVTVLVAGGVAERMAGGTGGDQDDLIDARRLASDEQIKRARKRAGEILQENWAGVCSVCDSLQRWPLLKGATVRALLEAARAPKGTVTRTGEDTATATYEVVRIGRNGIRKRAGLIRLVAGWYHSYHANGTYMGRFADRISAGKVL
jgi:hypothetical protein